RVPVLDLRVELPADVLHGLLHAGQQGLEPRKDGLDRHGAAPRELGGESSQPNPPAREAAAPERRARAGPHARDPPTAGRARPRSRGTGVRAPAPAAPLPRPRSTPRHRERRTATAGRPTPWHDAGAAATAVRPR